MHLSKLDQLLRQHTTAEELHLKGISSFKSLNEGKKSYYDHLAYEENSHGQRIYNFTIGVPDNIVLNINSRFEVVPLHRHNHIEINYMYSGSCEQTIDGKTFPLKKGQMTFIDTRTPHSIGYTNEDDILINFIIQKEYLNNAFFSKLTDSNLITSFFINTINNENTHLNYMIFNTEYNERLQMFIHEFIWEYFFPSQNSQEMKNSLFILIILELINTLETSLNFESISESNSLVISASQYMEKNFLTCTLEDVARHTNVNPCYLTTLLKKYFHYSYKELIIQLRMQYASKLLMNSDYTIDEIARQSGYQNLTFFYKKFKEYYHCSPKNYRQNIKPQNKTATL